MDRAEKGFSQPRVRFLQELCDYTTWNTSEFRMKEQNVQITLLNQRRFASTDITLLLHAAASVSSICDRLSITPR